MYAGVSHTEPTVTIEHRETNHTQGTDQVYHNLL